MRPAKTLFPLLLSVVFLTIVSCSSSDDGDPVVPDESTPITLTTTAVTNVTQVMATTGGEISGGQGQTILSKGVVWSTSSNPTINNNVVESGSGDGNFSSEIRGLDITTNYFVRAYVTTDSGTTYGNELSFTTLAHKVFQGVIQLTGQASIDGFGSENYSKIEGGLIINGVTVENLNALSSLVEITNPVPESTILQIFGAPNLQNFQGLENLRFIEQDFGVSSPEGLTSVSGLDGLREVGGDFIIAGDNQLTDMQGLGQLQIVGADFLIESDTMKNFQGLNSLTSIGNKFIMTSESMAFESFAGLENLQSIGGDITLRIKEANYSLSALDGLTSIGGDVFIRDNEGLVNFNGFNNITSAPQGLYINDNDSLTTISGFNNLADVGGLVIIRDNLVLEDLSGLAGLSVIDGFFDIINNASLTNLDAFGNLANVTGNLTIQLNGELTDFCGLQNLIISGGLGGVYNVQNNAYNPTEQDIIDGNCSL